MGLLSEFDRKFFGRKGSREDMVILRDDMKFPRKKKPDRP